VPAADHDLGKILAELGPLLRQLGAQTVERPIPPGTRHVTINITIENVLIGGSATMANYENKGQVGAMGDRARSDKNTFVQATPKDIDLAELAKQLSSVRAEMKRRAKEHPSSEDDADAEIGTVALAEKAAKGGDPSQAVQLLKTAGKWTLGIATAIAAKLVTDVIEGKFG
jgi:hypothetical protein